MSQIKTIGFSLLPNPLTPVKTIYRAGKTVIDHRILRISIKIEKTQHNAEVRINKKVQLVLRTKKLTAEKTSKYFVKSKNGVQISTRKVKEATTATAVFVWPVIKPILFIQPESYYEFIIYQIVVEKVFCNLPNFSRNVVLEHIALSVVTFVTLYFASPYFFLMHVVGINKEIYLSLASALLYRDICHVSSRERMSKAQQHLWFLGIDFLVAQYPLFVALVTVFPMDLIGSILQPICRTIKTSSMPVDAKDVIIAQLKGRVNKLQSDLTETREHYKKILLALTESKEQNQKIEKKLDNLPQAAAKAVMNELEVRFKGFGTGEFLLPAPPNIQAIEFPEILRRCSFQFPLTAQILYYDTRVPIPPGAVLFYPPSTDRRYIDAIPKDFAQLSLPAPENSDEDKKREPLTIASS